MNSDGSERIHEFFVASTHDLTPASLRRVVRVLYSPVLRDTDASRHCASTLSDAELERAERFVAEHDKDRFIQRRAFRRFCGAAALESSRPLSQIVFEETEKGRPWLPDLSHAWFSFSSCRFGFLGAWSSIHGIGIDLEDQSRNLETVDLARRFFSDAEANSVEEAGGLERQQVFFRLWSLKEAALKSIGEGLPFGLDTFEFELNPHLRIVRAPADHGGPEQYSARLLEAPDGCAALVLSNRA